MKKIHKQERALEERYTEIIIDAIDAYAMFRLLSDIADDMVREHPHLDPKHAKQLGEKPVTNCPLFEPR